MKRDEGRARWASSLAAVVAWALSCSAPAAAQELEPRAYSASPVGASFAAVAYQNSWGALLFDPTVPITDSKANVNAVSMGYGRTFALGGVQALALVGVPYARGSFSGKVVETDTSVTRSGFGDLRAKISANLIGGPALGPKDFARATPKPFLAGMSLTISAPVGQYYRDKLVNIGSNRWAFKPEVGISYNWRRKWYTDVYGGVWLFTTNSSAYPGSAHRRQDPMPSVQGHLSYTLARRTWVALDGTWFWGGGTSTNGGPVTARMDNKRIGAVLALGLTPRQSLKLSYSFGASVRVGDDFGTAGVAYQLLWF